MVISVYDRFLYFFMRVREYVLFTEPAIRYGLTVEEFCSLHTVARNRQQDLRPLPKKIHISIWFLKHWRM